MGMWVKRIEVVNETGKIKNEKLKEQKYKEKNSRVLEIKAVECGGH